MPAAYEAISSTTLSSASTGITISSIPATYTDLRVVLSLKYATSSNATSIRFNGDTASNYSYTYLYSNGSSNATSTSGNETRILVDHNAGFGTTQFVTYEMDIFSYTSSANKMILDKMSSDGNGSGAISRSSRCWRNSAAINSIVLSRFDGGNYATGTSMTVWGILKA
jgi:hypothetical protein